MAKYNNFYGMGVLPPSVIFGAIYFDHWTPWDLSTLNITDTNRVNTMTSIGLNGGVYASSGSARPITNPSAIGSYPSLKADGVSEFMEVSGSTATYKFLHNNNTKGCILTIAKITDANPNNLQCLTANCATGISIGTIGFGLRLDDRSGSGINNFFRQQAQNLGLTSVTNNTGNNNYPTQQFNVMIDKFDCGNATAADRGEIIVNGNSYKNNAATNSGGTSISDNDLTLFKRPTTNDNFFKGELLDKIILNDLPTNLQLSQYYKWVTYKFGTLP